MPIVLIDDVEYIPKAEVPELVDERLRGCLMSLTEIQYFSEMKHKHRAWAWDALNALAPELASLAADNPEMAYDRVRCDESSRILQLEHNENDAPIRDCDCRRCAIAERDRLRTALSAIERFGHSEGHGRGYTCATMAAEALRREHAHA